MADKYREDLVRFKEKYLCSGDKVLSILGSAVDGYKFLPHLMACPPSCKIDVCIDCLLVSSRRPIVSINTNVFLHG